MPHVHGETIKLNIVTCNTHQQLLQHTARQGTKAHTGATQASRPLQQALSSYLRWKTGDFQPRPDRGLPFYSMPACKTSAVTYATNTNNSPRFEGAQLGVSTCSRWGPIPRKCTKSGLNHFLFSCVWTAQRVFFSPYSSSFRLNRRHRQRWRPCSPRRLDPLAWDAERGQGGDASSPHHLSPTSVSVSAYPPMRKEQNEGWTPSLPNRPCAPHRYLISEHGGQGEPYLSQERKSHTRVRPDPDPHRGPSLPARA